MSERNEPIGDEMREEASDPTLSWRRTAKGTWLRDPDEPPAGASFSDLSLKQQIEQFKRELDNALQREEEALKRAIRVERELATAIRERDGAIATESETNRAARSLAQKLSARIAELEEAVIDSALEARRRGRAPSRDFPTPEQLDAWASEDAAARHADSMSIPTYGDGYRDAYLRMSREVKP